MKYSVEKHVLESLERNEDFGSSLLLANSPMFPKIVDGSFAAIFNESDIFHECSTNVGQMKFEDYENDGMNNLIFIHFYIICF